jgi:hypothetical protein
MGARWGLRCGYGRLEARFVLSWAAVVLAGARCHSPTEECPGLWSSTQAERTDILLVVEDAATMGPKQAALATALPNFVQELQSSPGVKQDFQIGVVTSSVYQQALFNLALYYQAYFDKAGRLQPVPDRSPDGGLQLGSGTERILVGSDPNLVDKLTRLVQVGGGGSPPRSPLESTRLSVTLV